MNKKIKIIDLLKLYEEQLPKKIIYKTEEYVLNGRYYFCCDHDSTPLFSAFNLHRLLDFINDEVEILEDNTEEIEETNLCYVTCESDFKNMNIVKLLNEFFEKNDLIVNELARAVNQIRKEKE